MSLPRVSVIIPTYNAQDFIIESVESVLSQDYPNLEVIIADDCSTDNTQQILKDYFKDNPNVKLFLNEANLGVTKNCNLCLQACTGKYVALHAGDDVMLPGKISTQVEYLEKNEKCVISYHNVEAFDSKTNKRLYLHNSFLRFKARNGDAHTLIKHGCFCAGCSLMIRREYMPKTGYDERFKVGSDWFFWVKTLINGGEIHYINKILARYRRHEASITASNSTMILQSYLDTLNICNDIIINDPQYAKDALGAYGVNLRGLRKQYNGRYYTRFLYESLKFYFDIKTLIALILNILSFGRLKL